MVQPRSMLALAPSDIAPQAFRHDADRPIDALQVGLLAQSAYIDPKYLYDSLGSSLFTAITQLPEYYPTRCEAEILRHHAQDIAAHVGTVDTLIDLGAGDCNKAEQLFPLLKPSIYVPIDVSKEYLMQAVTRLRNSYEQLAIFPVEQDFHHQAFAIPATIPMEGRLFFYPGSSIGNLEPERAVTLLTRVRRCCKGGGLLLGVDRVKSRDILEPAYDDALRLTAAFNLNMLRHVNQQLGSNFDVGDWQHLARYDEANARVQMFLEAKSDLRVSWDDSCRDFRKGERIHTENSYKYTPERFRALLTRAGFSTIEHWTDTRGWFSVFSARAT